MMTVLLEYINNFMVSILLEYISHPMHGWWLLYITIYINIARFLYTKNTLKMLMLRTYMIPIIFSMCILSTISSQCSYPTLAKFGKYLPINVYIKT